MTTQAEIKQQVREFYNQVGWQEVSEGVYQNAHYEDLRPVSRDYIHRCNLRICRHLKPTGRYLLDAGSGPIQYPEYLEYSKGYQYRVCADLSSLALQEARQRIGEHGLYVVADIANLPFKPEAFEGTVSLHTIHHLPEDEHLQAYRELYRTLAVGCAATVVNGWPTSSLMRFFRPMMQWSNRIRNLKNHLMRRSRDVDKPKKEVNPQKEDRKGTFTDRHGVVWVKEQVGGYMPVDILVWRSVSVRFLRTLIHPWLGGRFWLRLLFWLEERYPSYFGENGQYPLIVIDKATEKTG
jgi:SAM-dependent methyltransferase